VCWSRLLRIPHRLPSSDVRKDEVVRASVGSYREEEPSPTDDPLRERAHDPTVDERQSHPGQPARDAVVMQRAEEGGLGDVGASVGEVRRELGPPKVSERRLLAERVREGQGGAQRSISASQGSVAATAAVLRGRRRGDHPIHAVVIAAAPRQSGPGVQDRVHGEGEAEDDSPLHVRAALPLPEYSQGRPFSLNRPPQRDGHDPRRRGRPSTRPPRADRGGTRLGRRTTAARRRPNSASEISKRATAEK